MKPYVDNPSSLQEVGISLHTDERVEAAVELEGGLLEEMERRRATLLLTNKRLLRHSEGGHRTHVVSASLVDIDTIEVNRTDRNLRWVWVSLVFIAGGVALGVVSLLLLTSPISPLLMSISLILIGIVFMLTYIGGMAARVVVRAGAKNIKCRIRPTALDDAAILLQRYYELKLDRLSNSEANETGAVGVGKLTARVPSAAKQGR